MKSPNNIESLFENYLSGSYTETELRQLVKNQIGQHVSKEDNEKLQDLLNKLDKNIHAALAERKSVSTKVIKFHKFKWVATAAIITLILGLGLFYFHKTNNIDADQNAYANDAAPGKVGATLTLGNGQKIRLGNVANGEIAKQAGITLRKTSNGQLVYEISSKGNPNIGGNQYNTLSTANGETYMVILPDGSKIWMNAASSLTYATALIDNGKRKVKLQGEAYFEISKDKDHPFIVDNDRQQVEVLGTHFNVNAYNDENAIKTTLLEGSIKIGLNNLNGEVLLKPNQEATLTSANKLNIANVDAEEAIAWKKGEFVFTHDDFRSVMRKIGRWYNIEVIYEESAPFNLELGGVTSRSRNISSVLRMMEKTGEVHFKIEGKKVIVSK